MILVRVFPSLLKRILPVFFLALFLSCPVSAQVIDFDSLHEWNPDIYAWISIPDTQVDYPLLHSFDPDMDDDYYLNATPDHEIGYPGSIYTERCNSTDFTDVNTLIYGHNMRDGSMFGSLREYVSADYMAEHPYIYIYTEDGVFVYEIIASVVFDDRFIPDYYEFETLDDVQDFIDDLFDPEWDDYCYALDKEDIYAAEDTFITLSTCVGGDRDSCRRLTVARLLNGPDEAMAKIRQHHYEMMVRAMVDEFFPGLLP